MTQTTVKVQNLRHTWPGGNEVIAIDSFALEHGESVFLAGPSGSGKSTLLGLIAGITPVQSGSIEVLGQLMDPVKPQARDRLRADQIGMIFQLFNLVPYLTAVDNVLLPLTFSDRRDQAAGNTAAAKHAEAKRLLGALGLPEETWERASSNLSVGQQQRVAAARALIGAPGLIVADEPTSALDDDSRDDFLNLLSGIARENGASLLFVSHDRSLATRFDRFVDLAEINHAGAMA
ncbi:ABC transporter ATP-binding protein [Maricaulis sp.]|uniref:ABC transporter ATP-binding protein n=1 Tax=Maricaulis sp. TaxID=1486257 RepID=UPI002604E818|nr:ABC transporter ATP-binding protein [Maricaulis sp.]